MAKLSAMYVEAEAMLILHLEDRDWPAGALRNLVAQTVGCSERTVARAFYGLPEEEYYARQPGDRSAMLWCRRR